MSQGIGRSEHKAHHLQVEVHHIRRFVPSAMAIGVDVAGAAVHSLGRLLLGFNELHVNDGHLRQHLETKHLVSESHSRVSQTFMGGASTNVAKSMSQPAASSNRPLTNTPSLGPACNL